MAKKRGRPTNYKAEYNELAYNYCLLGATDKVLGQYFNVDEATINRWKISHPNFCESIKRGKEEADVNVVKSLYKKATGYRYREEASTKNGIVDLEKQAHPDATAIIFWLKNRQSATWRDKNHTEHTTIDEDGNTTGINFD